MINVGKVREGEQIHVLCCSHDINVLAVLYHTQKIRIAGVLVKKTT